MRNPLNSFPTEKMIVQSLPGFVIAVGILLYADALLPDEITASIFTETQAGFIAGFILALAAAVLGLILDTAFHIWGRRIARWMNWTLAYELRFRHEILNSLGLQDRDFEWVKEKDEAKISEKAETRILRFTEVTATTAYALLLSAPGLGMYLAFVIGISTGSSLGWVAGVLILVAVLVWLSNESLAKFEKRRTSSLLDDVYSLGRIDRSYDEADFKKQKRNWPFRYNSSYAGVVAVFGVVFFLISYGLVNNVDPPVDNSKTLIGENMRIIVDQPEQKVPVIELKGEISRAVNGALSIHRPKVVSTQMVVVNTLVKTPVKFEIRNVIVNSDGTIVPDRAAKNGVIQHETEPWRIQISLVPKTDVQRSSEIAVQAVLAFTNDDGVNIIDRLDSPGDLLFGERIFDIVVVRPDPPDPANPDDHDDKIPSEPDWLLARVKLNLTLTLEAAS